MTIELIQGDFLFGWSFSAKTGHILQGILLIQYKFAIVKISIFA